MLAIVASACWWYTLRHSPTCSAATSSRDLKSFFGVPPPANTVQSASKKVAPAAPPVDAGPLEELAKLTQRVITLNTVVRMLQPWQLAGATMTHQEQPDIRTSLTKSLRGGALLHEQADDYTPPEVHRSRTATERSRPSIGQDVTLDLAERRSI